MNTESYLDDVLVKAANDKLRQTRNKVYNYKILDAEYFCETIVSGRCIVINRWYSKDIDCDMITIEDLKTQKQYSVNQFRIELKEVY